jgi:hypothetical protein
MSDKEQEPRRQVTIAAAIHRRVRIMAAETGQNIGEIADVAISRHMDRIEKAKAKEANRG